MTCAHNWGPPQHFLRCGDGTLAEFHIRICDACYLVDQSEPCHCTTEERRRAAEWQRVLGAPPQGWGAA